MKLRTPARCLIGSLLSAVATLAQQPIYSNGDPQDPANPRLATGLLARNGAGAPPGESWSELADVSPDEANGVAGFASYRNQSGAANFRLADDFTVPSGQMWRIDRVSLYAYRTGNNTFETPFAEAYLQLWRGRPGDAGSKVVFGDLSTNRLVSSTFRGMYRIFNSVAPPPGVPPSTTRPIWENLVDAGVVLDPGTYWLEWTYKLTNDSFTAFSPAVTIPGVRGLAGWNARQYAGPSFGWLDAVDTGAPSGAPDVPQDFAFILRGVPEPATGVLVLLGVLQLGRRLWDERYRAKGRARAAVSNAASSITPQGDSVRRVARISFSA